MPSGLQLGLVPDSLEFHLLRARGSFSATKQPLDWSLRAAASAGRRRPAKSPTRVRAISPRPRRNYRNIHGDALEPRSWSPPRRRKNIPQDGTVSYKLPAPRTRRGRQINCELRQSRCLNSLFLRNLFAPTDASASDHRYSGGRRHRLPDAGLRRASNVKRREEFINLIVLPAYEANSKVVRTLMSCLAGQHLDAIREMLVLFFLPMLCSGSSSDNPQAVPIRALVRDALQQALSPPARRCRATLRSLESGRAPRRPPASVSTSSRTGLICEDRRGRVYGARCRPW